MSWKCSFIADNSSQKDEIIASNWIHKNFNLKEEIEYSIEELADNFEIDHLDFLNLCKGKNPGYIEWYRDMQNKLNE
jgi:hypothetical protein